MGHAPQSDGVRMSKGKRALPKCGRPGARISSTHLKLQVQIKFCKAEALFQKRQDEELLSRRSDWLVGASLLVRLF